jgi:uroporphyrinogen decarboxylase
MTDAQWDQLLRTIRGQRLESPPVGLIIDSPWLPGWAGMTILDYFSSEPLWLEANLRAAREFPGVHFLPGFWSEYGMCTEPSAFGAKCIFYEDSFPSVSKTLYDCSEIARLKKPDCRSDGLLPLTLHRLRRCRREIEAGGHRIRFAVARGPLNIASYLLGHTEFLMAVKLNPDETHKLLGIVTEFLCDWIGLQADTFDSIEGVFLLDDLIGFLRDADFQQFALPYLKAVFDARPLPVKFLHNDAHGLVTARHLAAMGVNLFNFSFNHGVAEMAALAGESVTLLGNVPPRDVLAQGTPDDVRRATAAMLGPLTDRRRLVVSVGGGTAPGTPSANIHALCAAVQQAPPSPVNGRGAGGEGT